MRIATWNVNSLKVRLPRVEEWLGYAQPDVLCLQETKLADATFPHLAFAGFGYESVHHGDGRWNGVAILSRVRDRRRGVRLRRTGRPRLRDPHHHRTLRRHLGDQRVCPERAQPRFGAVHVQAGLAGQAPPASGCGREPRRAGGGLRRLQYRSGRSRRLGPEGLRGLDPRQSAGAGRPARRWRSGAWSTPSGPAIPTTASSATGTTGPATSTSIGACASTCCSCHAPCPTT